MSQVESRRFFYRAAWMASLGTWALLAGALFCALIHLSMDAPRDGQQLLVRRAIYMSVATAVLANAAWCLPRPGRAGPLAGLIGAAALAGLGLFNLTLLKVDDFGPTHTNLGGYGRGTAFSSLNSLIIQRWSSIGMAFGINVLALGIAGMLIWWISRGLRRGNQPHSSSRRV